MFIVHYKDLALTYDESKTYTIGENNYIALRDDIERRYLFCKCLSSNTNISNNSLGGSLYNSKEHTRQKVAILAIVCNKIILENIIESYRRNPEALRYNKWKEHNNGKKKTIC